MIIRIRLPDDAHEGDSALWREPMSHEPQLLTAGAEAKVVESVGCVSREMIRL